MKTTSAIGSLLALAALGFLVGCGAAPAPSAATATAAAPRELAPLQLIQRIPVPNVAGRLDHFTAYPKRRLLIFAALGNNSLEMSILSRAKSSKASRG